MKRLLAVAAGLGLLAAGCTTHEYKYEGTAPPEPASATERAAQAHGVVNKLLPRLTQDLQSLPTVALATLTETASIEYGTTRPRGDIELIRRMADELLQRRLPGGPGNAFSGTGGEASPRATISAGRALAGVYLLTKDDRYGGGAAQAARATISSRRGWARTGDAYGVRNPPGTGRFDVSLTADAALMLERLSGVGGGEIAVRYSRAGYRAVTRWQTGRGRWFARVGTRQRMSLHEWSITLFALSATLQNQRVRDIGLRGLEALNEFAFQPWGEPRRGQLIGNRGLGPALALIALGQAPGTPMTERAVKWAVEHRRPDGTFEMAAANDATAQAYALLAFARRGFVFEREALP